MVGQTASSFGLVACGGIAQVNPARPALGESTISVVLPVYNEAAVLRQLFEVVTNTLQSLGCGAELVFVNDGSTDGSDLIIDELAAAHSSVRGVHLSRNFGHQAAVHAGLSYATGDAVIVMDSDMQDNPASLADLIERWQAGYDVVYAIRTQRKEGIWKRSMFFAFYRLLNLVSNTSIPNDAGNFGLIDRRVVATIQALVETDRYFPGLRSWVGYRQIGIPIERLRRHDEHARVSLLGLLRLAKTALFSFSSAPLLLFYVIGGISMTVFAGFSAFTLYHKFVTGLAIPGWTSTIVIASLFGALNALGIAVLGEYVVRIYDQVRARPQFVVARDTRVADCDQEECVHESVLALSAAVRPAASGAGSPQPEMATES